MIHRRLYLLYFHSLLLVVIMSISLASRVIAEFPESNEYLKPVREILREVPLIDGHNDVPIQYRMRLNYDLDTYDFGGDLSGLPRPVQTDLATRSPVSLHP